MAKIDLQYDLLNYTPASASPPQANFSRIEQHINQELIERGGTVAMVAQLKLVGDPVAPLDAAPKQYVDHVLPVGVIMMFGGVIAPAGGRWAVCNGVELDAASYPDLYAVLGSRYSAAGTPAGRFNLPNLVDRFPIGAGSTAAVGASGGNKDAVVPSHSHVMDHGHPDSTSGDDSPDHNHGDDHNHSGTTGAMDRTSTHSHGTGLAGHDFFTIGTGIGTPPGGAGSFNRVTTTAATDINHLHPFSTNYKSQQGYGTSTGPASARHRHGTSTPAMTGRSGTEGVAATDANLPPYVAVTYIIRIS